MINEYFVRFSNFKIKKLIKATPIFKHKAGTCNLSSLYKYASYNYTAKAKSVVMGSKPPISTESDRLDAVTLEEMTLNVGSLATVYLKPVNQVFKSARTRKIIDSPALQRPAVQSVR